MVGAPLMIVKNRDGQFSLSSFLFSPLIFKGRPKPSFVVRVERGGVFDRTFREHKKRLGLPGPLFLTVAEGHVSMTAVSQGFSRISKSTDVGL